VRTAEGLTRCTLKPPLESWSVAVSLCPAGFWTIQNFVRPFRFAVAVAMAPAFDSFMSFVQDRFQCRRQTAFAGFLHACICQCLATMHVLPTSFGKALTSVHVTSQCTLRYLA
jgi:hypothetical protein